MPIIEANSATNNANAAVVMMVETVFSRSNTVVKVSKPEPVARIIK